ncbi:MAG: 6-bladed beta-propeller [Candidatus Aminicenantales bacterium]
MGKVNPVPEAGDSKPDRKKEISIRKRILCLLTGIGLIVSCSSKQSRVDKIVQDGVEVVLNHLEPYPTGGKPVSFRLEEETRIDFSSNEFADLGIAFPEEAQVDSEGSIYVLDRQMKAGYFIFKFDKAGRFVKMIGRSGQGPGELEGVTEIGITSRDEIWANSSATKKIAFFSKEGDWIRETRYEPLWWAVTPLENGDFIVMGNSKETTAAGTGLHIRLYDAGFKMVKLLDFYDWTHLKVGGKTTGLIASLYWKVHKEKIYIGNEQRGYEILVYDLNGRLVRKIRKEHSRVNYPEEFRKATELMARRRPEIYAPEHTPPFNSFFIDDNDYLYVMTYEKGSQPDEYLHDIFDEEGVFVGRVSLGLAGSMGRALNPMHAIARGGRYYRLRFKEDDDYPELITYKMIIGVTSNGKRSKRSGNTAGPGRRPARSPAYWP